MLKYRFISIAENLFTQNYHFGVRIVSPVTDENGHECDQAQDLF